ncbi:EFC12 protein, partial [Odontophorus gujanensis]|nr:EFC12 protein [Odontophorus gujanensis]
PQMASTEGRQDKETFSFPVVTSHPEDDPQYLLARIQETKLFFSQLDKCTDIEKWLRNKSPHTYLERRVWERIKARKAERKAMKDSLGDSKRASSQPQKKAKIPLCPLYPQALVTLHNLLHKQKTTLVNVFKKAGMERKNIYRADFIKVIKQTNIPISEQDLEDIIIFLTAPKRGKYTTTEKLMESQKEWLEIKRKESRQTTRATCKTATSPPPPEVKDKELDPTTPLEVTPVHGEPEQGHLTDDTAEETSGSRTQKAIKRQEMKKVLKERSHLGKSGEDLDKHCFPSTMGGDRGKLIDQYRRKVAVSYQNCSKLCKERSINLSDPVLQKGLLHPDDIVIQEGKHLKKIRQPGGYYSSRLDDESSLLRSEDAAGDLSKEDFYKMICREKRETRNDNMFWPGHLLDKIRLCIPEERTDRTHPLFSCVRRPTYWHI